MTATHDPHDHERSGRDGIEATGTVDLHEPIARELAEPRDGYEPPPMWLIFLALALTGFGGWYLGTYSGGFSGEIYDETIGLMSTQTGESAHVVAVDPMVLGKRVYNNCMACHQRDGAGIPGNYPPLDGSTRVTGSPELLAAVVIRGLEGEIDVDGVTYNQVMPSWSHLTDEQIAAVATYVRSSWGNEAGAVETELVADVRERIADGVGPLRAAELPELDLGSGEPSPAEG